MRVELVIFDLDGTLLDTIGDLSEAVNYAMEIRGFARHSAEEYKTMVGHGVRNLVTLALPPEHRDEATVDGALGDFRRWYEGHIAVHTRPFPGIPELLRDLSAQGVKLAVASNKFQEGTTALIEMMFPGIPFVAVLGNRPGLPLKPDAEVVRSILRAAGLAQTGTPEGGAQTGTPEGGAQTGIQEETRQAQTGTPGEAGLARAVLVGDSGTDIRTAQAGGIAGIGVAWGYRPADALAAAGAAFIAPDVPTLRRFLLSD